MALAVISDVHANIEALEAVLGDIKKRGVKDVVFLGDAVGYGPNPNECVAALTASCGTLLAGNHDWAVLGRTSPEYFNPVARAAIEWTEGVLSAQGRAALEGFALVEEIDGVLLVHASPDEPDKWHYLFSPLQAAPAFGHFSQRICLVGHSHIPFVAELLQAGVVAPHEGGTEFLAGSRYIINAGSVGQPRDGDPRACYALLGGDGVEFVRVEYPVRQTQRKMRETGLPEPLAERLSLGR